MTETPPPQASQHPLEQTLYEVKKTIVGQDELLQRMLVALLARGHLLVEGVPGLAKTMAIKTLAQAIGGEFKRIQFTPDLVPADVVGTRIYNQPMLSPMPSRGDRGARLVISVEDAACSNPYRLAASWLCNLISPRYCEANVVC